MAVGRARMDGVEVHGNSSLLGMSRVSQGAVTQTWNVYLYLRPSYGLQGTGLSYSGKLMAVGRARMDGVEVHGNSSLLGMSGFEAYAKSTAHRPAQFTFTSSGQSLQVSLPCSDSSVHDRRPLLEAERWCLTGSLALMPAQLTFTSALGTPGGSGAFQDLINVDSLCRQQAATGGSKKHHALSCALISRMLMSDVIAGIRPALITFSCPCSNFSSSRQARGELALESLLGSGE